MVRSGHQVTPNGGEKVVVGGACEGAGLTGFHFHWLRTTTSTAMVALGVEIKTAQTPSRHRRSTTTLEFYVQPTAEADRRAAQLLGSHFFGGEDASDEADSGSPVSAGPMNARNAVRGASGNPGRATETGPDQGETGGGASWNRTSDLSIISAAL